MRRRIAHELRRYPRTYATALLRPDRLQQPDAADRWTPPLPFTATSYAAAWALAALFTDENILRGYEWPPWVAPLAGRFGFLPGFSFLAFAIPSGLGMLAVFLLAYAALWLTGREIRLRRFGAVLAYFAGGPAVSIVALLQCIGLPLLLGGLLTLPEWLNTAVGVAVLSYLLLWLARGFAALPGVGWWRGALATAAGAVVVGPAPFDPVKLLSLEPYAMTVESMAPQIGAGSIALANEAVLGWRQPARGELVIFRHRLGIAEVGVLRRIVGMPGETVELRGGRLLVNGVPAERAPLAPWRGETGATGTVVQETLPGGGPSYRVVELDAGSAGDDMPPTEVPGGHVFVLADNRDAAIDSRQLGPVPVHALNGIAYYQLRPEPRRLR